MKNYTLKIALIALGLFVSFSSFAQLNITQSVQTKPEKLLVVRMSYAWLYKTSEGYSLCMNTSNKGISSFAYENQINSISISSQFNNFIYICKSLLAKGVDF